jgi:hypothetical protein
MQTEIDYYIVPTSKQIKNLIGQKFFRLTVIGFAYIQHHRVYWYCHCDCGNIKAISANNLRNKSIKSCGCYRQEFAKTHCITHGEASQDGKRTVEYKAYIQAKIRCNNPNRSQYKYYGGRGIEFRFNNFPSFLAEVGRRPSLIHSLDRIDNNKHYEVGNVRWATHTEQTNNQSKSRFITIDGITNTLSEWCKIYKIDYHTAYSRLKRLTYCDKCVFTLLLKCKCPHK